MQAGDHGDAGVLAAGADRGVEGGGDVGEALTPGLQLQQLQVLTHPHRPLTLLQHRADPVSPTDVHGFAHGPLRRGQPGLHCLPAEAGAVRARLPGTAASRLC